MAFIDNWSLFLLILCAFDVSSGADNSTEYQIPVHWNKQLSDKQFERIEINRFCDINENCTHSLLCIDNRCQCRPNHKWNRLSRQCESFDCKTNETECQVSDPNRKCRHISLSLSISSLFGGQCECNQGYYEDKRNLKCRKYCHNNKHCDPSLIFGGHSNNMVCVDFLCQCRPNTKWNITTNKCEAFNCTKDVECWEGADENRECINGECLCYFQEDFVSTKCYLSLYSLFRVKNYKTRKERLLLCTIFIMPSVVLYCLYAQHKKRKSQKLIAQTLDNSPPNINYIYLTKNQELKTTKI